jgi:hypothetical protein
VGTIEDKNKKATNSNDQNISNVIFEGISEAMTISHNKVQVGFKPAVGGSGNFSYLVYLNGNFDTSVVAMDSDSVRLDQKGMAYISVPNLSLGTAYTFSVKVYDKVTEMLDTNVVYKNAETLRTEVPNFDGVKTFENVAGIAGETSLLITWNKATPSVQTSGGFGGDVHDVGGYNIYYGTSEDNLTNVIPVLGADTTSYTLSGLTEGTQYFVRVRAFDSNLPPVEEQNLIVLTKKTLTTKPIVFSGIKSLSIPSSAKGYNTIIVNWDSGTGSFDRYKVYFSTSASAFSGAVSTWSASNFEFIDDSITDTGLKSKSYYVNYPNTKYYVAVLACAAGTTSNCDVNLGGAVQKNITTTPPVVSFAGIKASGGILPVDGIAGLTDINLYWDAPDASTGVFKRIEIYDCYDMSTPLTTTNNGVYDPLYSQRITGLTPDVKKCFVALAVEDSYLPIIRKSTTTALRFYTPKFVPPLLTGPSSCSSATPTSFQVNWPAADGVMFAQYEVYIKKKVDGQSFDWSKAIDPTNQWTNSNTFSSSASSDKYLVSYTKSTYDLSLSVKNILSIATTYQIGVRTYLDNGGGNIYRSDPGTILDCSTSTVSAIHQGWLDVFSIGPKVDGVVGGRVKERLFNPTVEDTTANKVYKHSFPVEDAGVTSGVSGSDQGIIRLNWYDFKLSNDQFIYKNKGSGTGYKVYRKAHSAQYNNAMPQISESVETDNTWELRGDLILASTGKSIPGKQETYFEFIDYDFPSHPDDEGRIYYYRIEAYINGKHLDYAPNNLQVSSSDLIIRVVLPPKNMAFMHRWMANKQMCDDMSKTWDRTNNYRCSYTGLGSVRDPVDDKYYYDIKGDTFIDRFLLACPFSRGGSAKQCSNTGDTYGKQGALYNWEGRSNVTGRNITAGDCIGVGGSPDTKMTASKGAIFFDRSNQTCYINTSTTTTGKSWKTLDGIDGIVTNQYGNGLVYSGITSELRNEANTSIPPSDATFIKGENWGSYIYSNDAGLPQLQSTSNGLNWTCQSATFKVNGTSYKKRLLRRIEQIPSYAMSPFLDPSITGLANRSGEVAIATGIAEGPLSVTNILPLSSTSSDRDCHTTGSSGSATTKAPNSSINTIDLNPRSSNSVGSGPWKSRLYGYNGSTASWFPNGSSGKVSTDACITRFGLQDYVGGGNTVLSDTLYCKKSDKFCSFAFKNFNSTTTFTPPWDAANRDNWKNATGAYASFSNNSTGTNTNRIGIPFLYQDNAMTTIYGATTGLGFADISSAANMLKSGIQYYSVALGVPLICGGTGCFYTAAASNTDDTGYALQAIGSNYAKYQVSSMQEHSTFNVGVLSNASFKDEFTMSLIFGNESLFISYTQTQDSTQVGYMRRYMFFLRTEESKQLRARCAQKIEGY